MGLMEDCAWRKYGTLHIEPHELEHLRANYLNPLDGIKHIGASIVADAGHDAYTHPAMLDELEIALSEAIVETTLAVMREHGLKGPADG